MERDGIYCCSWWLLSSLYLDVVYACRINKHVKRGQIIIRYMLYLSMFKISWQHLSAGLEICMKVSVSITFVNMIGFQYLYLVALNMLLNFRKLPRLFNQLIYYTPNLRIYRYLTVAEADTSFPV